MFVCLHARGRHAALLDCARAFSPLVEDTSVDAVVFDATGLGRIHRSPARLAAAVARQAAALEIEASVAAAANPDAAVHAARGLPGVTVIRPGGEAAALGGLPLELLDPPEEMLRSFDRWGVHTFRDLASLPPNGVAARLGPQGSRLQQLARGAFRRPLVVAEDALRFEETLDLDDAVSLIEPLLFLIARLLGAVCARLEARGLAAIEWRLRLKLQDAAEHARTLRLPVPMRDAKAFLKLMQLDLESHAPPAPVEWMALEALPAKPRAVQTGLFLPPVPEPEKLEITLARLAGVVGEGNVGAAELLDTHRPDAFRMREFRVRAVEPRAGESPGRLAFRVFRPARRARVEATGGEPAWIAAEGIRGKIVDRAGPWHSSGDWWKVIAWAREEWDVALEDGAVYRIFRDREGWFVEGLYD